MYDVLMWNVCKNYWTTLFNYVCLWCNTDETAVSAKLRQPTGQIQVKVSKWTNRLSLWILEASKCEISRGYEFSCSIRLSKLLAFQKTFLWFFEKNWRFIIMIFKTTCNCFDFVTSSLLIFYCSAQTERPSLKTLKFIDF